MKKILTPVLFFAFVSLSLAQVVQSSVIDQDIKARTQTIAMDLIVQGSECVGFDCPTNQSFGFSTILLKENNLRIKFEDTSNSGSFPSNDWTIEVNNQNNGGTNHFAILDDDGGKVPFKMIAGAPTNSIFLNSSGNLGLGTGSPALEVHVADGDSPGLRLEQNNSAGFAAQSWDIAGNETNFFVRDVTNASKIPFKIFPNAPTNSLTIEGGTGDIGIGTTTPEVPLHVKRSNGTAAMKIEENNGTVAGRNLLAIINNGPARFTLDNTNGSGTEWQMQSSNSGDYVLQDNADPSEQEFILDGAGNLEITGDLTANGMLTMSDRRLKTNISDFNDGLEIIKQLRPVTYDYNGSAGLSTQRTHIGLVAQDLQEVAPYLVFNHNFRQEDQEGNEVKTVDYLKIDEGSIRYLLVNAIKEQQKEIEEKEERISVLENEIREFAQIRSRIEKLENIFGLLDGNSIDVLLSGAINSGSLGQNIPNPYRHETKIEYFVPEDSNVAEIQFFDAMGMLVKKVILPQKKGRGVLNLQVEDLPAGSYTYTLFVDSRLVETKKMLISK